MLFTAWGCLDFGERCDASFDPAEGLGVGFDGVDLPGFVSGAVYPHLVLAGVAAGGVVLDIGCQARAG
jgi:hypothetical protein